MFTVDIFIYSIKGFIVILNLDIYGVVFAIVFVVDDGDDSYLIVVEI